MEGVAVRGTRDRSSDGVRTHYVARAEGSLASVASLGAKWEMWPALGIGVDLDSFAEGDFKGQGGHVSLRDTFIYTIDPEWGLSGGITLTLASLTNTQEVGGYIEGARVTYAYFTLMLGVVRWAGMK
jgi:hypothetical protein